ncbi:DUF6286 domain-containing protein [Streptomyces sp. NPDC059874]|uniref:DUF6286 domain-containing protein n=1 Tax=Streptomyces sp. NPDC059874 TaxID=3346983 RepID=UPI00364D0CA5
MKRDHDPSAEKGQPTAADDVTSRTVIPLTKQPGPQHRAMRPWDRPWSARRIPAAVTALIIAAAAGLYLVDITRVRAGRRATWRTRLADELATRPLNDMWIQIGAAAIALLGLWLIVLAITPGLRHQMPLQSPDAHVRALLDRDAAALLLRDAAMRVPGVSAARIRIGRHRIDARATVRFRPPADVKTDLLAALQAELSQLALAHPPWIAARVRARRK